MVSRAATRVFARFATERREDCVARVRTPPSGERTAAAARVVEKKRSVQFGSVRIEGTTRREHASPVVTVGNLFDLSCTTKKPVSLRFFREFEPYDPWH